MIYLQENKYGGKFYSQHDHIIRERVQLFRHDVLALLPPFASLSVSAQPTSASTKASPYMSFHIFLEVTLEVK